MGDGSGAAHRHAVLLAEDDHDTREAFVLLAEAHGLETVVAANGQEALDRLRAGLRPCVIVLDLAMPVMDGFTFRRAQLADPALADIPVAVMSGGGWASESEARKLGLTVFLRKPVDPEQLVAVFERDCGAR
jgi:CheY-like chemotaxis protein